MRHIRENRSEQALAGINAYIREDTGDKKLFQVSGQLARLFDDYQLYRPDMLMAWQKGANRQESGAIQDKTAEWQAFLWRKIASAHPEAHLAYKATTFLQDFSQENFNRAKFNKEGLPERICLFGISNLPELFLKILEKVSKVLNIHLFLLTPSNQFFFDLRPERDIEKIALKASETGKGEIPAPEDLYYESGNPLLSSLGSSCQEFHAFLENLNYQEAFDDLFSDPLKEPPTLLSVLQSDILNLTHRKKDGDAPPFELEPSDSSLSVHSCHSPMREAQVLKDLLLKELEREPDLFPHDIIVMMPDIETYAPFIESVFSLENDLLFSISDRRRRSESEPLEAFLKILALKDSGFEKNQVLDLLLSASIAGKFGISQDDLAKIEKMAEDAGILWGRDQAHRQAMGFPLFSENTWEFGLNRLFMGMAMPEAYEELVEGVLPCESFEGLELELLGKLAAFIRTLFSGLAALEGEKSVADWCRLLRHIAFSLLERQAGNNEDLTFLSESLNDIENGAKRAGFSKKQETGKKQGNENSYEPAWISFEIIHALLKERLDFKISRGNFMSGAISFCNITPMRSIPFKIVALMGMDEQAFPGTNFSRAFDLMRQYPRPGDKNKRHEDQYLFLETLLSARKKLIISYTGQSMADNSPVPPSGVISELKEVIQKSFIFPDGADFYYEHPLHPFNTAYFEPTYFNSSGPFFSYSDNYCRMAKALMADGEKQKGFFRKKAAKKPAEPLYELALEDMIRFFRNPIEAFFRESLNLTLSSPEEYKEDREAFAIKGLDQYWLGSRVLEKLAYGQSYDRPYDQDKDIYPVLRAGGFLPPGKKGRLEYENLLAEAEPLISEARQLALKAKLPVLRAEVLLNDVCITGQFADIYEDGLYFVSFGRLNGARLLFAWIRHLFLNAAGPADYPKKTIITGRDPDKKKPFLQIIFPELGTEANVFLENLAQIYQKGLREPFRFFPETSYQLAKALSASNFDLSRNSVLKAMNRAKKFWFDGFRGTGEKQNRYAELFSEGQDPFESLEALLGSGFVENALLIYKPIIRVVA